MPWGDGTGPWWIHGRGYGRGFWICRRWGIRSYPGWIPGYAPVYYTREQEIEELKAEREAIMEELKAIEQRLRELEKKK
ncbi:MAG TPA: hypothetical protein ENG00_01405 [Candidatus Aenigmarchaeota archaeon]|nr:hypothetical protein [Candidatus Aenigmarchaeota archaeon]